MSATVVRLLRDATEDELRQEPDTVLDALAAGEIRATETTRALAAYVLGERAMDAARRSLLREIGREVYPPLRLVEQEAYGNRKRRRWLRRDPKPEGGTT